MPHLSWQQEWELDLLSSLSLSDPPLFSMHELVQAAADTVLTRNALVEQ